MCPHLIQLCSIILRHCILMDFIMKTKTMQQKIGIRLFSVSCFIFIATALNKPLQASQPMQLAAFIGSHVLVPVSKPVRIPPRNSYWTNWGYVGYGCVSSCLINRWSGKILRCERRCY